MPTPSTPSPPAPPPGGTESGSAAAPRVSACSTRGARIRNVALWLTRIELLVALVFVLVVIVYVLGIFVPLKDADGGDYARLSMEMYDTGVYHELRWRGEDWLDKPHFQFWVTAFSYELFGVNGVAYKLPAILFTLLGVFYTYRFGARFYSRTHGLLAALFLTTAHHHILANEDVRAEAYLTGLTIFALYYFARYLEKKSVGTMVLGCAGLAGLLMTKGTFTVIPVVAGVGGSLLVRRQWKEILHPQWLLALLLTLVFTLPTLVCYYLQFDLHPEKVVWGETGVSGIEFFFWTSQWGRFSHTGPILRHGSPVFFLHTMLWAFAPWALLAAYALFAKSKQLVTRAVTGELYCYFGFLVLFILFSLSRFQLPHYVVPLFPMLSILTAEMLLLRRRDRGFLRRISRVQLGLAIVLAGAGIGLHVLYLDRSPHGDTLLVAGLAVGLLLLLFVRPQARFKKIVLGPAVVILAVNYYFNREFFPDALRYQSETEMAYYLEREGLPPDRLVVVDRGQYIIDVALQRWVPDIPLAEFDPAQYRDHYVYTHERAVKLWDAQGVPFDTLKVFEDFRITRLDLRFVNRATRHRVLERWYLIRLR